MDKMQELEWLEAQKIEISKDLMAAAKQHLEFLAAVDRRRFLYDGPMLDWAIYRYKTCWLPLLAKHADCGVLEGSLVVPLDCEWIWHCHRLNPVQYKKDCEKFYGRILDNQNVESSLSGNSKDQSAEIWAKLYPEQPFDLNYSCSLLERPVVEHSVSEESITYDLVSAVKRQSTFYYQVSRPGMQDDRFLEGAVARYKGFLHLIKRNYERSLRRFCVPTYDIDLIWHSHQLQPVSYCKDMLEILGKILEHDDTDPDRSKGKKLDTGFSETTQQWEDTYGLRYWRAGSMYRGNAPSPLGLSSDLYDSDTKSAVILGNHPKLLPLQTTMIVEVFLEIVGVRNLPAGQNSPLFVSFSKNQPDMFFSGSCTLSILSECGEKQLAGFQCEPTGHLVLALMSNSNWSAKTIGTASIPFQELMDPKYNLSVEKWFELKPRSGKLESKPVSLHVAASFTAPFPAPQVLHMYKSHFTSMNTCFFPLVSKVQKIQRWTRFVDGNGSDIISLQMRNLKERRGMHNRIVKRSIVGVTRQSRNPVVLAEFADNSWSLKDSNVSLCIEKLTSQGGSSFDLICNKQIKLFAGRRLEFEPRNCDHIEFDFITVVEFSSDHPYGKAVALLDTKSCVLKVSEEQFALPAILLLFILKKEGCSAENMKQITSSDVKTNTVVLAAQAPVKGGGCGGECGAECGNMLNGSVKSGGGCGSGCGGECGVMVKKGGACGGCGAGCGGECGAMVKKGGACGGCGAGCGGECGAMVKKGGACGGCGAGCGGGCGDGGLVAGNKSSGCGSGCGGCGAEVGSKNVNMTATSEAALVTAAA